MSSEPIIGTLQEGSLHSSLKELYLDGNARAEVLVDGYVVDIIKDGLLIEIQTSNFAQIKTKLFSLFSKYPVRLVHPISQKKWIVKKSLDGLEELSRRLSPKRGDFEDIFDELVRIPSFIVHPNFSLELILIEEEEVRRQDGKGSWRRKGWSIVDRRLVGVIDRHLYEKPSDFLHFIPDSLEEPFTNSDLVKTSGISNRLAQRLTYCLRKMNVLKTVGKSGKALLHEIV